ncbi:MAG: Smr/MutS family protein [Gemmatimonadales bacterium]
MTFDLHGLTVLDATHSAEQFLRAQQTARRGAVVRLITGRGSHGGPAPIRTRVRSLLKRLKDDGTVVADYVLEATDGSFLVKLGG